MRHYWRTSQRTSASSDNFLRLGCEDSSSPGPAPDGSRRPAVGSLAADSLLELEPRSVSRYRPLRSESFSLSQSRFPRSLSRYRCSLSERFSRSPRSGSLSLTLSSSSSPRSVARTLPLRRSPLSLGLSLSPRPKRESCPWPLTRLSELLFLVAGRGGECDAFLVGATGGDVFLEGGCDDTV